MEIRVEANCVGDSNCNLETGELITRDLYTNTTEYWDFHNERSYKEDFFEDKILEEISRGIYACYYRASGNYCGTFAFITHDRVYKTYGDEPSYERE